MWKATRNKRSHNTEYDFSQALRIESDDNEVRSLYGLSVTDESA